MFNFISFNTEFALPSGDKVCKNVETA